MTTSTEREKFAGGLGCLATIGFFVFGAYWLWQQAAQNGWAWHEKIAVVTAKAWSTGEYKTCSQLNIAELKDEPQIDCTSYAEYGEAKKFKVRFYGDTYKEELGDKAGFTWQCKKNDGTDPAITCDQQKTINRDEKK